MEKAPYTEKVVPTPVVENRGIRVQEKQDRALRSLICAKTLNI